MVMSSVDEEDEEVLPAIYCGQEFMIGVGSKSTGASLYYKSQIRNGSPPWRNVDKDGHMYLLSERI
ncbi:hypothetical protein C5167_010364 [Papaver somniferum]|uniref:Uncharacterized protein n=1 Tax=Papaver somniferum TaxID=3469 RepID=A0A4Y7K3X1_PAPSO|nr:hypothetical protein C5167_010364 [Papaver somniferum]